MSVLPQGMPTPTEMLDLHERVDEVASDMREQRRVLDLVVARLGIRV